MDGTSADLPSRGIRRGMVAFLVVFLAFGLIGLELWPMTAWRLFSLRRHETVREWQAFAVGEDGDERELEFFELPMGYRLADRLLPGLDEDDRPEYCAALVQGIVDSGGDRPEELRFYVVRDRVPTSAGDEPEPVSRELRWTC